MNTNYFFRKLESRDLFLVDVYFFIKNNHEKVEGDWSPIFYSNRNFDKFSNYVRNLIRLGVITKPNKVAKQLLFEKRHVLELLIARNYKSNSVRMATLASNQHIKLMSQGNLRAGIFIKNLPDCDRLREKHATAIIQKNKENAIPQDMKTFHHVNIGKGLKIQFQEGEYSMPEITHIINYLKKYSH